MSTREYRMNRIKMKQPKMIIFDAGKTLIDYVPKGPNCGRRSQMAYLSVVNAVEMLMPFMIHNPHGYDAATIDQVINETFVRYDSCRKALWEIHDQIILKTSFELLDVKFSISLAEIERIIWENSAEIEPMEGVSDLLARLNEMGIRTAVISNLDFSGFLLEERLQQIFPHNQFEFVIASSDYGVRKPQSLLFEVGIAKSGLNPAEIWYVGDKIKVDVDGSRAVGMEPVLYKNTRNYYEKLPEDVWVVEDYREMVSMLHA